MESTLRLKNVPRMSSRIFQSKVGNARDTEQFADEKWDEITILEYVDLKSTSYVKVKGFRDHFIADFISKFGSIYIKPDAKIVFKVNFKKKVYLKNVKWYWKVRNVGEEAIKQDSIRGQLFEDGLTHEEPIKFRGPHFVEVYGIQDRNTVVAFGKIDVPLEQP